MASGPSSRRHNQVCRPPPTFGFSAGASVVLWRGTRLALFCCTSHHWRILSHLWLLLTKCGLHPPDMSRCISCFQTLSGKVAMPRPYPKVSNDVLREAITEICSDKGHWLLSGSLGLVLGFQLSDFSDCAGRILFPSEQDTAWSTRCELWFCPVVCHLAFLCLCDAS